MNKKLYIFFSLTSFAYMLSVSVYLLNSFIMLNDTIFAVTRILMICCLLIFLLFGLKLKTIAKIEGNNQTLTKFQHIQKVWSIVIITSVLAYWYLVKYFWLLLPFYDTIKETAVISYGKTKKVQNQTYG